MRVAEIIDDVIGRLDKLHQTGPSQWSAVCPAHPDKNASLSVSSTDEKVLLFCHAGCSLPAILLGLNLQASNLFADGSKQFDSNYTPKPKIKETYPYTDEKGNTIFEVVRYEPKSFRQRHPDGNGGWFWNGVEEAERVIYRLPRVLKAIRDGEIVFIVEGEKDVHTMEDMGLTATCNPGGGGVNKWLNHYNQWFVDADVHIISDRDTAGYRHALGIMEQLRTVTSEVHWWEPPSPYKDITAVVNAGMGLDDLINVNERERAKLLEDRSVIERKLIDVAHDIQLLAGDYELDSTDAVRQSQLMVDQLDIPSKDIEELWTFDDLVNTKDEPYDWVIPGLFEHQDRWMILGKSGAGKSMIGLMTCLLAANGIHPFNDHDIVPIRSLIVDTENSERSIRRKSRGIINNIKAMRGRDYIPDNAKIWPQPSGLNLLKPADVSALEDVIAECQPDLVYIGPIYKLMIENSNDWTGPVQQVQKVIDYLRIKYGCCFILEHHVSKDSSGRKIKYDNPSGSSYWGRWLDYGIGMVPDDDWMTENPNSRRCQEFYLNLWKSRGDDDVHCIPFKMRYGNIWPWEFDYVNDNWRKHVVGGFYH